MITLLASIFKLFISTHIVNALVRNNKVNQLGTLSVAFIIYALITSQQTCVQFYQPIHSSFFILSN
jgi:Tfp pilus assembly pilus retraction ATPase PilT